MHGISTHYMPTTANRFEILSDLNEVENRLQTANEPRGYFRRQQRKPERKEATPQNRYCTDSKITNHARMKHDNTANENPKDSTRKIPVVINGLTPPAADTSNKRREYNSSPQQHKDHKIIIIGDSHARGAASNVQHNLDTTFGSSGFVSPGANMSGLTSSMTSDTKHLKSKDAMILWGGANDVYRNNSTDALKHITNFVDVNKHTNVIILCVPHRHDLPEWSCVNTGIKAYNRTLAKLMKPRKHVTVVQVDLDRKFFTRHGQHMNNLGKELIALRLASVITDLLSNQEEIITLHWKDGYEVSVSDTSDKDATNIQEDPKTTPSRSTAMEVLLDEAIQENQTDSDSVETGDNEEETDSLSQTQYTATTVVQEDENTSLEQTQDTTSNTWSASMDKTTEIRRTSTRNKKAPSTRGNDFLWQTGSIACKMI